MRRRNIALGILVLCTFLIGIFLKNIRLGLIVGVALGLLIGLFSSLRK